MRRILTILLVVLISIGIPAQTRKTTQKKAVASKTTGRTKPKKQTTTRIQTIAPTHQVTIVWHTQSGRASTSRKQKKMLKLSTNKLHLT